MIAMDLSGVEKTGSRWQADGETSHIETFLLRRLRSQSLSRCHLSTPNARQRPHEDPDPTRAHRCGRFPSRCGYCAISTPAPRSAPGSRRSPRHNEVMSPAALGYVVVPAGAAKRWAKATSSTAFRCAARRACPRSITHAAHPAQRPSIFRSLHWRLLMRLRRTDGASGSR